MFEIRAKEDIVTSDGTVRAEKGSAVATLITGEDGTAESDELFPGKYEIRETAQTSGYVRRAEPYEIELTYTESECSGRCDRRDSGGEKCSDRGNYRKAGKDTENRSRCGIYSLEGKEQYRKKRLNKEKQEEAEMVRGNM